MKHARRIYACFVIGFVIPLETIGKVQEVESVPEVPFCEVTFIDLHEESQKFISVSEWNEEVVKRNFYLRTIECNGFDASHLPFFSKYVKTVAWVKFVGGRLPSEVDFPEAYFIRLQSVDVPNFRDLFEALDKSIVQTIHLEDVSTNDSFDFQDFDWTDFKILGIMYLKGLPNMKGNLGPLPRNITSLWISETNMSGEVSPVDASHLSVLTLDGDFNGLLTLSKDISLSMDIDVINTNLCMDDFRFPQVRKCSAAPVANKSPRPTDTPSANPSSMTPTMIHPTVSPVVALMDQGPDYAVSGLLAGTIVVCISGRVWAGKQFVKP